MRQGFTGHEMLDNLNLIHMNGRVYDQHAARFISPDPFIDGVEHTQGWNRYAYVKNAPLSFTDPTGFKCYSTCLPTDPWNRRFDGLHGYSFSNASSDPANPDRPGLYDLAHNSDLRNANYNAVREYERGRDAQRIALIDRSHFMEQLNREYRHETGAREHLTLPRHGSAPARSTVGGNGSIFFEPMYEPMRLDPGSDPAAVAGLVAGVGNTLGDGLAYNNRMWGYWKGRNGKWYREAWGAMVQLVGGVQRLQERRAGSFSVP